MFTDNLSISTVEVLIKAGLNEYGVWYCDDARLTETEAVAFVDFIQKVSDYPCLNGSGWVNTCLGVFMSKYRGVKAEWLKILVTKSWSGILKLPVNFGFPVLRAWEEFPELRFPAAHFVGKKLEKGDDCTWLRVVAKAVCKCGTHWDDSLQMEELMSRYSRKVPLSRRECSYQDEAFQASYLGIPEDHLRIFWDLWGSVGSKYIQKYRHGALLNTKGAAVRKAAAQASEDALRWCMDLWSGKPDWILKNLETEVPYHRGVSKALKWLGDGPATRLLSNPRMRVRGEDVLIQDWFLDEIGSNFEELWPNIPAPGRIRSWNDLDDLLHREVLRREKGRKLPVHPDWAPVQGLSAIDKSWRIVVPRHGKALRWWGDQLSHCVGSYSSNVENGDCVILQVYVGSRPSYTLELIESSAGWVCRQFFGSYNTPAPEDFQEEVLNSLNIPFMS